MSDRLRRRGGGVGESDPPLKQLTEERMVDSGEAEMSPAQVGDAAEQLEEAPGRIELDEEIGRTVGGVDLRELVAR